MKVIGLDEVLVEWCYSTQSKSGNKLNLIESIQIPFKNIPLSPESYDPDPLRCVRLR